MTQPPPDDRVSNLNSTPSLFGDDALTNDSVFSVEPVAASRGVPRVKRPVRDQYEFRQMCLDDLVPSDHPVRAVWMFVMAQDLFSLYDKIAAVEGEVGRDAIDPRILMALWLFATVEGIGSAREIERRTTRDNPFRWICGGVSVNHDRLSRFRTGSTELLDDVLTNSIAVLMQQGLVSLKRVAQDGMRVRASAGRSSFRREQSLQELHTEAKQQVEALKTAADETPSKAATRQKAARERAAIDREARVAKALAALPNLYCAPHWRRQPDSRRRTLGDRDWDVKISVCCLDRRIWRESGRFSVDSARTFGVRHARDAHPLGVLGWLFERQRCEDNSVLVLRVTGFADVEQIQLTP